MRKLNQKKVRWIVRQCVKGDMSQRDIALVQKVTPRWVRKLHSEYRKTGQIPELKRCGRKRRPMSDVHRSLILREFADSHLCALYLEKRIRKVHRVHIPHNAIHMVLKENCLAQDEPSKKRRRKWVRYERRHSLSLVHTDWHEHNGRQLIAFLDDASRDILSCMEFDSQSGANTLAALEEAAEAARPYGGIEAMLTDNGSQFVPARDLESDDGTRFQKRLNELGTGHIRSRVGHPQTNGKMEKFFDCYDKHRERLGTLDGFITWYRTVKPHRSLDFENGETPSEAFRRKLKPGILLGLAFKMFGW